MSNSVCFEKEVTRIYVVLHHTFDITFCMAVELGNPYGKAGETASFLTRKIPPILLRLPPHCYMCFIEAHSYSTAVKSRRKSASVYVCII